jgi:adenylyltransferase/sulfurtransferase
VARLTVELPSALTQVLGGRSELVVEGATLREALRALVAAEPALGVHVFDESEGLRRHVLCFLNGRNTRWLDSLDVALADGDRLRVMQAVSGG